MDMPKKRQSLNKGSNYLQVPAKRFRLSVQSANNSDLDCDDRLSDCDSVFSDSEDKENRLLATSPPSPAACWDAGFCLDSPTRRTLQRDSSTLPPNIKKLGKGGFGTVVLGTWQSRRVAVKIMSRSDHALLERELHAETLDHPNIVKILKVFHADAATESFKNSLVVMEYVGHYNLMNVIQTQPGKLTQPFIVKASVQLSKALEHCHKQGIVHLDVKPANVLVIKDQKTGCAVFKLADFGCSKRIASKGSSKTQHIVGTPGYQAPEHLSRKIVSEKCDVYSFGITLWQLVSKEEVIYKDMHPQTIIYKVASSTSFNPESAKKLTTNDSPNSKLCSLYRKCWSFQAEERPTFGDILTSFASLKKSSLSVGTTCLLKLPSCSKRRNNSLRL